MKPTKEQIEAALNYADSEEISVHAAVEAAKLPEEEQRKAVAGGVAGVKAAAVNFLKIMKQNQLENLLVFAARYAHNRPTGAARTVCAAIIDQWHNLRTQTQMQLQKESFEAAENEKDWQEIRNLTVKDPEL